MNQEKVMKRRMVGAIILFSVTFIVLIIFIALYVDETHRVQETYRTQYNTNLKHASEAIDAYLKGEGDYDMRYTRIISDMSSANSFAFLIEDFKDEQKTINEINSALIKYPEQMKGNLEELKEALDDMAANVDRGYTRANKLIDSLDKKGN